MSLGYRYNKNENTGARGGRGAVQSSLKSTGHFVDNFLVIELKAVDAISNLHKAQLLTYMRLAEAPIGLTINFNVNLLKDGIRKCAISDFSALSASSCVNS